MKQKNLKKGLGSRMFSGSSLGYQFMLSDVAPVILLDGAFRVMANTKATKTNQVRVHKDRINKRHQA